MKTVWVINHYATPPSLGGLNRHYYFAKNLKGKYRIKIVASSAIHNSKVNMVNDKSLYAESKIDGVDYIHIRTSQYEGNKIKRIFNILQFYFRGKRALKKMDKPDIIYASMPHPLCSLLALKMAKKFKVPCIVETRDLWPESLVSFGMISSKGLIAKIMYKLEKYIYTHADKLIFTMKGGIDYIKERKYSSKINLKHVYHLNNGADLEKIEKDLVNNKLDDKDLNDNKHFKVVYAGSIRFAYDIDQIVELAKKFKDNKLNKVKFLIYGEGNYKDELINKCNDYGLDNIVFKGFVDSKYIPYIMSKCQLALLHGKNYSVFRYGTSQNKLFTYLSAGKPIVSVFSNKYDIIGKNRCGKTLKTGSLDEYYKCVKSFFELQKKDYEEYCKNSKKLSKEYDYIKLSKKLEIIFEEE